MTALESLPLWACIVFMALGGITAVLGLGFGVLSMIGRPVSIGLANGLLAVGLLVFMLAALIYLLIGGTITIGPAMIGRTDSAQ